MKYIASVSFGKDSLAMLLKLLELSYPLDYVVFYDTGMEFEPIYELEKKVKTMLKGVEYVRLSNERSFDYWFSEHVKKSGDVGYSWCGGLCRWATRHKLNAINKFKKSLNCETIDYVGIAADEAHRATDDKNKRYPLIELGMTEKDCLNYCYGRGFDWQINGVDLYSLLDRVSCWCCANKNLKELNNIYRFLPQYWQKLKAMQSKTSRLFKGVGVDALEERFKRENLTLF